MALDDNFLSVLLKSLGDVAEQASPVVQTFREKQKIQRRQEILDSMNLTRLNLDIGRFRELRGREAKKSAEAETLRVGRTEFTKTVGGFTDETPQEERQAALDRFAELPGVTLEKIDKARETAGLIEDTGTTAIDKFIDKSPEEQEIYLEGLRRVGKASRAPATTKTIDPTEISAADARKIKVVSDVQKEETTRLFNSVGIFGDEEDPALKLLEEKAEDDITISWWESVSDVKLETTEVLKEIKRINSPEGRADILNNLGKFRPSLGGATVNDTTTTDPFVDEVNRRRKQRR